MNYKFIVSYVDVFEIEAFENYLNQQSQRGCQLTRMVNHLLFFKKSKTPKYYSALIQNTFDKNDPYLPTEETPKLIDFMKEFGYAYVCGWGPIQIFNSNQYNISYNDQITDIEIIKKLSKKFDRPKTMYWIFFIFIAILLYSLLQMGYAASMLILLGSINIKSFIFLLFVILIVALVYYKNTAYRKFKKDSLPVCDPSIFKWKRTMITIAIPTLFAIFFIIIEAFPLLIFYILLILNITFARKFSKYYQMICFIGSILSLLYLNVNMYSPSVHHEKPLDNNYPFVYSKYTRHSSYFFTKETYKHKDTSEITTSDHYIIKNTLLKEYIGDLLTQDLHRMDSQYQDSKMQFNYKISDYNTWILYADRSADLLKKMEQAYPKKP